MTVKSLMLFSLVFASVGMSLVLAAGPRESSGETRESPGAVATFGGGCFWCMEPPFDKLKGVLSTTVGYTGGSTKNPSYKEVSSGATGHAEAIRIVFDPETIGYSDLLAVFWSNIDPTTPNRQFCDWGSQYRPEIYYHGDDQKRLAEASKKKLEKTKTFKEPIATRITPASRFYAAEDYHQDYYRKNPKRYKAYREGCGRDRRLRELWGTQKK